MRRLIKISDAFAVVLKQRRLAKRFTHETLAERAGLHPTYISLLERFLRTPRLDVAESLANALDLSLAELISEAEALLKRNKRP